MCYRGFLWFFLIEEAVRYVALFEDERVVGKALVCDSLEKAAFARTYHGGRQFCSVQMPS
jgi:hypothetical protein